MGRVERPNLANKAARGARRAATDLAANRNSYRIPTRHDSFQVSGRTLANSSLDSLRSSLTQVDADKSNDETSADAGDEPSGEAEVTPGAVEGAPFCSSPRILTSPRASPRSPAKVVTLEVGIVPHELTVQIKQRRAQSPRRVVRPLSSPTRSREYASESVFASAVGNGLRPRVPLLPLSRVPGAHAQDEVELARALRPHSAVELARPQSPPKSPVSKTARRRVESMALVAKTTALARDIEARFALAPPPRGGGARAKLERAAAAAATVQGHVPDRSVPLAPPPSPPPGAATEAAAPPRPQPQPSTTRTRPWSARPAQPPVMPSQRPSSAAPGLAQRLFVLNALSNATDLYPPFSAEPPLPASAAAVTTAEVAVDTQALDMALAKAAAAPRPASAAPSRADCSVSHRQWDAPTNMRASRSALVVEPPAVKAYTTLLQGDPSPECGETELPWEARETETAPFPYDGEGSRIGGDGRDAVYDIQEQSWQVKQFPARVPTSRKQVQQLDTFLTRELLHLRAIAGPVCRQKLLFGEESLAVPPPPPGAEAVPEAEGLHLLRTSALNLFRHCLRELTRQMEVGCKERGALLRRLMALLSQVETAWQTETAAATVDLRAQLEAEKATNTAALTHWQAEHAAAVEQSDQRGKRAVQLKQDADRANQLAKRYQQQRADQGKAYDLERRRRITTMGRATVTALALKLKVVENKQLEQRLEAAKDYANTLEAELKNLKAERAQEQEKNHFQQCMLRLNVAWHSINLDRTKRLLAMAGGGPNANLGKQGEADEEEDEGLTPAEKDALIVDLKNHVKELSAELMLQAQGDAFAYVPPENSTNKWGLSGNLALLQPKTERTPGPRMLEYIALWHSDKPTSGPAEPQVTQCYLFTRAPLPSSHAELAGFTTRVCQQLYDTLGFSAYAAELQGMSNSLRYIAASEDSAHLVGQHLDASEGVAHMALYESLEHVVYARNIANHDQAGPHNPDGRVVHFLADRKLPWQRPKAPKEVDEERRKSSFLAVGLVESSENRTHGVLCVDTVGRARKPLSMREFNTIHAAAACLTRAFNQVKKTRTTSDKLALPLSALDCWAVLDEVWQLNRRLLPPASYTDLNKQMLEKIRVGQALSERLARVLRTLGWLEISPDPKKITKLPAVLLYSWLSIFTLLQKTEDLKQAAFPEVEELPLTAPKMAKIWNALFLALGADRDFMFGNMIEFQEKSQQLTPELTSLVCQAAKAFLGPVEVVTLLQVPWAVCLVWLWAETNVRTMGWTVATMNAVKVYSKYKEDTYDSPIHLVDWNKIKAKFPEMDQTAFNIMTEKLTGVNPKPPPPVEGEENEKKKGGKKSAKALRGNHVARNADPGDEMDSDLIVLKPSWMKPLELAEHRKTAKVTRAAALEAALEVASESDTDTDYDSGSDGEGALAAAAPWRLAVCAIQPPPCGTMTLPDAQGEAHTGYTRTATDGAAGVASSSQPFVELNEKKKGSKGKGRTKGGGKVQPLVEAFEALAVESDPSEHTEPPRPLEPSVPSPESSHLAGLPRAVALGDLSDEEDDSGLSSDEEVR